MKYQNHKFFLQFMKIGEMRKSIMDEEVLVVDKIYFIFEGQLVIRPTNIKKLTGLD